MLFSFALSFAARPAAVRELRSRDGRTLRPLGKRPSRTSSAYAPTALRNRLAHVGVPPGELGCVPHGQADHIVQHQDLAIALRAGADADGGNAQLAGDPRGELSRNRFEHDRKCARRFHGPRVPQKLFRRFHGFALNAKAAKGVHGLRSQPDMAHHRNFRFHQLRDQFHAPLAAFDLHRLGARFLHEPHRVAHRLAFVAVKAAVGHVRHQQRPAHSAPHRARVVQHLLHRERQRIFVAEHDHAQRIAHQHHVHARFVDEARRRIVVGRQANDLSLFGITLGITAGTGSGTRRRPALATDDVGHGDLPVARIKCGAHVGPPVPLPCRDAALPYLPLA